MRCRKCRAPAWLDLPRHRTAFCREHFLDYFRDQVTRAIREWRMICPGERVLVAVSGGKDSLALWDVLLELGYPADGLFIGLGIGGYSSRSREKTLAFARSRGAKLLVVDLEERWKGVEELARRARRVPCSACGLVKRYLFNRVAREEGYEVVATGHNLDDEAASLLGNVLRWQTGYLARQSPVLPEEEGFARKVKPLVRLTERETAAYAFTRGIDYVLEECPLAAGASSLLYKEVLNRLELESPGTKQQFLQGFLERVRPWFEEKEAGPELRPCLTCGQPTTAGVCAFCRLLERAGVKSGESPDLEVKGEEAASFG